MILQMGKLIKKYNSEIHGGWCEIHVDLKEEYFYIKYFNEEGQKIYITEEFPNKSLHYVKDAAENWCTGLKKLGTINA